MKKMKKRSSRRKAITEKVQLMDNETLTVGSDTHKKDNRVTVWSLDRDEVVAQWVTTSKGEGMLKPIEAWRDRVVRVVYEAGPMGFALARSLEAAGWPVQVISAAHTPEAPVDEDKCDRIDSRKLAEYAAKNLLRPVYVPELQEEYDRTVFRDRDRIARQVRRIKQQIRSAFLFHGVPEPVGLGKWSNKSIERLRSMKLAVELRYEFDSLLADLDHFTTRLKAATARLGELAKSERYEERAKRLQTVPGVGPITSMGFLLEMPKLERFATSRQLSRMLALSPRVRSSGETTRQAGRHKGGQGRLRSLLVEAAWQWKRRDALAFGHYNRMLANTGSEKKAITAVARKLAIILWRIAIGPHPYTPGVSRVPKQVFEGMKRRAAKAATA